MAEETKHQWEGKTTAKLTVLTAAQVWPLLEDFCSINKLLPSIETCYRVEGVYGQPGLTRYCGATVTSSSNGTTETTTEWCHEKLLTMDPTERCFSYEVVANNIGFKFYKSIIKVLPIDDNDTQGCEIEWSFSSDPIQGFTFDELSSFIDSMLQTMAANLGKGPQSTT